MAEAAIFDEEDLSAQIRRLPPDLKVGDILRMRFGIAAHADDKQKDEVLSTEDYEKYFMAYADEILANSLRERNNFFRCLERLGIDRADKSVLFDSLTVGTSAYHWRKLRGNEDRLLAMVLLNIPDYSLFDESLDSAYLGIDSSFFKLLSYTRAEFLNDAILSAPTPQVMYIDDAGNTIYSTADDKDYYKRIADVHEGAVSFAEDFLTAADEEVLHDGISPEFLDVLQGNLLQGTITVNESMKNEFFVVEQFSGRTGKIVAKLV